jgi:hypothetical protein
MRWYDVQVVGRPLERVQRRKDEDVARVHPVGEPRRHNHGAAARPDAVE